MSENEAFELIGHRAQDLAELPQIRAKMMELATSHGKEAALRMIYMAAVATLVGTR